MKHKIAIVGFGGMAGWHYDEIQTIENLEIAGIWDIKEKQRNHAADMGLHVYEGLEDLLADKTTDLVLDVHLMIEKAERYIDEFADCGADIITIHYEACRDLKGTLLKIRERGIRAGVVIKPDTPNQVLEEVLDQVDMILLMTVEPGFGGQAYIPSSTEKIRELKAMLDARGLKVDIEVDGGIKKENLRMVLEAGANVIVAGSAIFAGDIRQNVRDFLTIMQEQQKA